MKKLHDFNLHWKTLVLRPAFLILFIFVAFLPTVYCLSIYVKKSQRLEELKEEYDAIKPKVCKVLLNKNNERTFLELYSNADHFYTEKHLEKQQFLSREVEQLKFLSNYSSFSKCSSLKNRLQTLSNDSNRLRLSQRHSHTCRLIQETEEVLMNPIEIDKDDLCKLLVYIEGIPIGSIQPPPGRPNLQFTRFLLQKKAATSGYDAYFIDFDLVKREPATQKENS